MKQIEPLIHIINQQLSKITFPVKPKGLYEPISYTLNLGGKRIRPALTLAVAQMYGKDVQEVVSPAIGIELFHNFTLLHDDIMDEAPLRRGQPSVYHKWGRNHAILSGDVMYMQSIEYIMKCDIAYMSEVLSLFNRTAVQICEGQQYDMNFETSNDQTIDDYLLMIELKTAVLLGCALQIGGILSGASGEDQKHLYEFGRNLGVAFQLQDDILDVYGEQEKVGKKVGGDIVANKKTYLLLKAQELAMGVDAKQLDFYMGSSAFDEKAKVQRITHVFDKLNVRSHAEKEMDIYYRTALAHLDSVSCSKEEKTVLYELAEGLMVREY